MISTADLGWPDFQFASIADAEAHLAALKVSLAMAQEEGYICGPLQDDIRELEDLILDCSFNPDF
jgi:hypothetical protein